MANKKVSQLTSKPAVNLTDLFLIADPTSGQAFKTTISDLGTAIGSGVSSVNTLVGAVVLDTDDIQELASPTNRWFTDTRARAALSASSPLAYNSGTGVFSIPQATGSQNGYLTSTDWTTFNAKQAALSGTGFVKISGTTISYDNSTYLTTSAAASTYLALAGGTLTGALNGTSATFTGDLTLSASNPRLYLTDTDNNPDYFISNTDGTFTIYDVTNSTSRLTISTLNTILNTNLRVDGDVLIKQDSVLGGVSGYTAIASDTDGIFLKLGTASAHAYLVLSSLTNYRNFTFPDATGTLALTSDLSAYLPLTGGVLSGSIRSTGYFLTGMTSGSGALYYSSGANRVTVANYNASGIVTFEVNGGNTALTLNSNLSATFAGAISGTSATFSSSVTGLKYIANSQATYASMTYEETIKYSSSPAGIWFGNSFNSNNNVALQLRTSNNGTSVQALTLASTGAATFSSSVTANTNVTISSTGNASLVAATNSTGGYSFIDLINNGASGRNYQIGTAGNTAAAGYANNLYIDLVGVGNVMTLTSGRNVGIGTTAPQATLSIKGATNNTVIEFENGGTTKAFMRSYDRTAGAYREYEMLADTLLFSTGSSPSERMRITSAGNVGIGTTAPSQNLHVASSGVSRILIENTANASTGAGIQMLVTSGGTAVGNGTIRTDNSDNMQFFNFGGERMRITSGGNLLVAKTSDSGNAKLQVNGNFSFGDFGSVMTATSTTVSTTAVNVGNTTGTGIACLYFAAWFNTSGGAQGTALLLVRGGSVTIVSISDGSGCAVVFTVSGAMLRANTTTGTVGMGVSQINI